MQEENIKVDIVGGTSIGSIVAALYAMEYTPKEMLKLFNYFSKLIFKNSAMYTDPRGKKLLSIQAGGLYSGENIAFAIEEAGKYKNIKKLQDLKQTNSLSTMFSDQDGGMLDYYDLSTRRGKKNKKKNAKNQKPTESKQKIFKLTEITIPETISVKDLAAELKKTSSEVIKKLLGYGIMATINNDIDFDTAYLIAQEFGVTAKKKNIVKEEDILFDESEDKAEDLVPRAPVIVVMGHVDLSLIHI